MVSSPIPKEGVTSKARMKPTIIKTMLRTIIRDVVIGSFFPGCGLTIGTEVSTTLSYDNPLYGCAAYLAGLPSTLVDFEMVLKITATVNPIDACSMSLNPFL